MSLREQARLLALLVDRVDYDGEASTVAVTFRSTTSADDLIEEARQ